MSHKLAQISGEETLQAALRLLRARSSRYAWYGTFIASCAVVLACLLVAQHFHGGISYENVLRAQRENIAIWVLDAMPFLFAIWGQAVSLRTTRDAGTVIATRTSSLRRLLRAERVNARLRTDYFARLSHEFRTPLNAILGMTDALARKPGMRAFERDLGVIHNAAENLLALINDVLDYSAIEAGRMELDRVGFDLRECVTNACGMLRPQARGKGLELEVEIEAAVPHFVMGDPGRLRQVLVNLVGNAIKFTDAGAVRCRVRHGGERDGAHIIELDVIDTGRGIDERTLKNLFRPYRRAERDRDIEGSGLGLAICHEIVDAMGGEIHVASTPGEGSTFTVRLALEPQRGVSLARIARNIELRGVRLLLAEAPGEERARFEAQLRALGLDVHVVDDGVEAMKEVLLGDALGRPYELLVVDLYAEYLSGEALAARLKARPETADICLVAITASGARGDGKRVRDAGFAGYFTRPIPPEHLGELLRATLAAAALPLEQGESGVLITRHYIRENAAREAAVLLVEDERVGRAAVTAQLQRLGCDVTTAETGADALAAIGSNDFNLVLLDYHLPDGRGDEIVRTIIEQQPHGAPPIVIFSAGLTHAERQRCLRAGAVGFLEKPVNRDGLLAVLERYCRLSPDELEDGLAEPEVTPALRRVFVRESLTRMAELERAIGASLDRETLHRTAHTMRSSARHVGAATLADAFADLEELARDGSDKAIRSKANEVLARWRDVIELQEHLEADRTVRME